MKSISETTKVRRLLRLLRAAEGELPPKFEGMTFIRYVPEGRGWDRAHAWAIYISHDPCHDPDKTTKVDRNTVIAFHRKKGIFKVIGRELRYKYAKSLALGDV